MKWLFICAHPDDLEFFTGYLEHTIGSQNPNPQLITQYIGSGQIHEIIIASMTRGEMSGFTTKIKSTKRAAEIRTKELQQSCHILGVPAPIFLGFFDGFVRVTNAAIEKIQLLIENVHPDIVIAPEPVFTYYSHQDHMRTGKIVFYALMRIQKKNKTRKPLERIRIPCLYYFGAFFNHFYFPKHPTSKATIEAALATHQSQQDVLLPARIPAIITGRLNGRKTPGYGSAEALRRQYLPGRDNPDRRASLYRDFSVLRRILYYLIHSGKNSREYGPRMTFFDGTLPPDF
jgi:LmbE family N-acetylglucosaminyl deacetylase